MAKLKEEFQKPKKNILELLREENEEFDKSHPVLDSRWFVEEWKDGQDYQEDIYYPDVHMRTFGPFATEDALKDWLDKHDPDERCKFITKRENLRHYSYDKWGR